MSAFTISRRALSFSAAALLAGCGGTQPPLGAEPGGSASQQSLPRQAFRVLYNFRGTGDGTNPAAPLIDVNGTLYGTTAKGGAYGYGTVFSLTPSGEETVLHSFGSAGDGAQPVAGLLDVNGTLYGTTSVGGATRNAGTVFSITPSGSEKVLHSFDYAGTGGATPVASLIDVDDTLYGTTSVGGHGGSGTVFSITTDGQYNVLHYFGKSHDGISPEAALFDFRGKLYGTTSEGGGAYYNTGTIFGITTDGTENIIHIFKGSDGSHPVAALTNVNGVLYGTTALGGLHDVGTIFKISRDRNYIVLHNFGNGSGDNPYASLLAIGRTLYGTTYGVVENHVGNVFWLTP